MKCVICNSSDIQLKSVEQEIKWHGDIFLVPMQVLVCSSCGERYCDRKAMKMLQQMKSKIEGKSLQVKEVGRVLRVEAA
jgi:YgiT-type zinc finger domain-containing protein